jgi:hypothetical protein
MDYDGFAKRLAGIDLVPLPLYKLHLCWRTKLTPDIPLATPPGNSLFFYNNKDSRVIFAWCFPSVIVTTIAATAAAASTWPRP